MDNLHLLKIELSTSEYLPLVKLAKDPSRATRFPKYVIAICPYCGEENAEHLNTYSAAGWTLLYGNNIFSWDDAVFHCRHYTLGQFFINFRGIWPEEAKGEFTPEVPHAIGHILEDNSSLAVMHALPMCRPVNDQFVPSYTLYMLSYFAEQPKSVFRNVTAYNARFFSESTGAYIVPPEDCQHWWDLPRWVSERKLYWIDASTKALHLRTGNPAEFPYKNITGRKVTHQYPFPYPAISFR